MSSVSRFLSSVSIFVSSVPNSVSSASSCWKSVGNHVSSDSNSVSSVSMFLSSVSIFVSSVPNSVSCASNTRKSVGNPWLALMATLLRQPCKDPLASKLKCNKSIYVESRFRILKANSLLGGPWSPPSRLKQPAGRAPGALPAG